MKLRYCFVLLLLVCFLCGNVYAEDLNSNNITSDFTFQKDNQVAEEISDDVLPGTDDVLGVEEDDKIGSQDNVIYVDANALEDGDGSLDHPYNKLDMMRAFRLPSGSTIHLADGEYNFQYMILNDMVIVGESQNAIVKNTIFGSSRSSMFGGGDASSLLIHNLTFVNSSFVYYDNFAAVGCVFKGYSSLGLIATSTNADIYETTGEYASATFDDCGFVDCGGESCVMSLGSGVLEIKNSYVESARNVLVHAELSTVVLNNVTVKRSKVGGSVDFIQLEGSRIYVIRSSFEENNVSGGSLIGMGDGVDVIIFKSNFTDNNIDNGVVNSNNALVNITNSNFINNHAKRFAGAVFAAQSTLLLENVSFERNSALWSGGAVVGLNTTVQILTCNFSDNSASYSGGALYAMYGNVIVSGSVFNSNHALNGGAIFLDYVSSLNLGSVLSYGNEFDGNGNYSVYAITDRDYDLGLPDVFQTKYPNIVIGDGDYSLVRFTQSFNGTIPVYYDLRQEGYVTPVKNQGPDGNCWAFACIAVLESCILKAMGTTYDFSEENMKNIMAWFSDYGWDCLPNQGGHTEMSLAYLTSWLGPVYEDDDPYSQSGSISEVLHSPFHVQNILFLDYDDFDSIKKAIIEYGAVGVSMLWDEDYINNDAYYCWNGSFSNHVVAIVGWNDTYSRNNFAAGHVPEGDGAWIIKNSWGEDVGDNGYFYISYYDKAFAVDDTIFTFIFNDTVRFDKNYQYDFGGDVVERTYGQKTVWYKNVFNATGKEALAAVSTYFLGDSDYVISVYVNGQVMLTQSGVSKKGYYTINLNRNISLNEGDIFEVQFKISVDDGKAFIPIADDSYLSRPLLGNGVSFFSNDGANWVDLCSSANSKVACIKAFTVNEFKSKIDLSVNESQITAIVTDQYGNVLDGSVEFKVNNQSQFVEITDGKAILDWNFSYYDSYNITATWNKAGYVQSTTNMLYETPWDVTLNVNDVAYLEDVLISITLGEGKLLKNNITLTVGDYHYSLNQSNLMFTVPDTLNANHWNVSVSYVTGNGYEKSLNKSFNVNKKHINIFPVNDIYRETGSVRYNSTTAENRLHVSTHDSIVKLNPWQPAPFFNDFSLDDCIITFNGSYDTIERIDGMSFYLRNLKVGTYKLNITLNHPNLEGSYYRDFTIEKGYASLTIPDLVITYGESGQVTFDCIVSSVVLHDYMDIPWSDNSLYGDFITIDGKNIKVNSNLPAGSHQFSFIIDDEYWQLPIDYQGMPTVSYFKVTVNKASTNVTVNVRESVYNESVVVDYIVNNVNNSAVPYGSATVTVCDEAGEIVYTTTASNFYSEVVSLSIDDYKFDEGNYTVNIKYEESDNFKGSSADFKFSVGKAESSFDPIDDIVVTYGNYTVAVSGKVNGVAGGDVYNGTVTVAIDDTQYAVDVDVDSNGRFTVDLVFGKDVSAGIHKVSLSGTDCFNYNAPRESSFNLIIEPAEAKFNPIENITVTYGDGVMTVSGTVSDLSNGDAYNGTVTVEVNGKYINTAEASNHAFDINLPFDGELNAGNYTITVSGSACLNYKKLSDLNVDLTVKKATLSIASVENITVVYGVNNTVNVTGRISSTRNGIAYAGKVTVFVNNKSFEGKAVGGVFIVQVTGVDEWNVDNYTLIVSGEQTDNYNAIGAYDGACLNIVKQTPVIDASITQIVKFGQNANVTVCLPETATGIVYVEFNRTNYTINLDLKESNVTLPVAPAGTHDVIVYYSGDKNYNVAKPVEMTFTVDKVDSSLLVGDIVFDYGGFNTTSVAYEGASNITAYVVGHSEAIVTIGDKVISVSALNAGSHVLSVTTVPDKNHNPVTKNVTVTVNKIDSVLNVENIEFDYGSVGYLSIDFEGASNVTVTVINHTEAVISYEGKIIAISDLSAGSYKVNVTTVGDKNHNPINKIVNLTVKKVDSTLNLSDIEFEYGGVGTTIVDFTGADHINASVNDENAVVTIRFISPLLSSTIFNNHEDILSEIVVSIPGYWMIQVSNLTPGSYILSVTTVPDKNHNAVTKNVTVMVNKASEKGNINIPEITPGKSNTVPVSLGSNAKGNITLTINNEIISVTPLVNGSAMIEIPKLASGKHVIAISYSGDENHANFTQTHNVNVASLAKIISGNVKAYYADGSLYKVRVFADDGTPLSGAKVTIKVNGKKVAVKTTDKNGYATYKITQKPKSYTITAEANGLKATNKLKVKQVIKAKKTTKVKKSRTNKIKITLKGKKAYKNKKLTIKFKGKKYKVKTNKKGVAKFKITKKMIKKFKKGKKVKYTVIYRSAKLTRYVKIVK